MKGVEFVLSFGTHTIKQRINLKGLVCIHQARSGSISRSVETTVANSQVCKRQILPGGYLKGHHDTYVGHYTANTGCEMHTCIR